MLAGMIPVRQNSVRAWAALAPLLCSALLTTSLRAEPPKLPGVGAALQEQLDRHEIAGAVTMVVTSDAVRHLEAAGFADMASRKPMQPDTVFWIASMTKPITAAAVLMLQDEGKLDVRDPVSKYLPEFAPWSTS